jgi:hypothetical protein
MTDALGLFCSLVDGLDHVFPPPHHPPD